MLRPLTISDPALLAGSMASYPLPDTTSMTMWFKGDTGTLLSGSPTSDGGTIDQWVNQIGTTDALQSTPADRPTWHANQVNGLGIVRFDGSSDYLSIAHGSDTNISGALCFFFITKIPAFTDFTMLLTKNATGANSQYSVYVWPPGAAGRTTTCGDLGACRDSSTVMTANVWVRTIVEWNVTDNDLKIWRDGVRVNPTPTSRPTNASTGNPALIGTRVDGFFNAYDLLEMGVWNRDLTSGEITALDQYMQSRLGLI